MARVTIDVSNWTDEQRNLGIAAGQKVAFEHDARNGAPDSFNRATGEYFWSVFNGVIATVITTAAVEAAITQILADASIVEPVRAGEGTTPVAAIMQFHAGATIPDGWIATDGRDVSRRTYYQLFNVIGTTYGIGDGSTTFGLPTIVDHIIKV